MTSLSYAIQLSKPGDDILIDSIQLKMEPCGSFVLTHSLSFEGTSPVPISCYVEHNETGGSSPPTFSISDGAEVTFKNIIFTQSELHVQNAHVEFHNCSFLQTMIFVMDDQLKQKYDDKTTSRRDNIIPHFLQESNCSFAFLLLNNSTLNYTGTTIDNYMDTFLKFSIQIVCKKLHLEISEVNFESHFVYLASFELNLTVRDTYFSGPSNGSSVPTNFIVFLYTPHYNVQFYNVTFTNIYFSDLLALLIASHYEKFPLAALVLKVYETRSLDSFGNKIRGSLEITECYFVYNHRGISLYLPNENHTVIITNSTFIDNQSEGDGGAIFVTSSKPFRGGNIYVDNCYFGHNQAGVIPFDMGLPNCRKRRVLSTILILDCFFTGDHIFTIQTCVYTNGTSTSDCFVKTSHLQLSGNGGAINIEKSNLYITNSTFWNNTAEEQGGAIISIFSAIYIRDSHFHGSFVHPSPFESSILTSHGTLVLEGSYFYVHHASDINIILHAMPNIENSAKMSNIQIFCPINSIVNYFNSSSSYLIGLTQIKSEYYEMEIGWYGCRPCGQNQYSLSKGLLNLSKEPNHFGLLTTTVNSVRCYDCPFGGKCYHHKGLISQPNYWGLAIEDQVEFYICPNSYCCSKHNCKSYNVCEQNRNGTLCGRCSDGFSESMISTKCIANEKCQLWGYAVSLILSTVIFILFLIFHRDLKSFLFSSSKARKEDGVHLIKAKVRDLIRMKTVVEDWQTNEDILDQNMKSKSTQTNKTDIREGCSDEGVIFLLLFCYYFQDIGLFTVNGIYTEPDSKRVIYIKRLISSIFKLHLNFAEFYAEETCVSPNFDPVSKAFLRNVYLPIVYYIMAILAFYICRLSIKYPTNFTLNKLANKVVVGLTMSVLISYQTLAIIAFQMITCVKVGRNSVLFLDGNVVCFTWWQWSCLLCIVFNIFPFTIYLAAAPKYIKEGHMSLPQFYLGCVAPLFVGFYHVIRSFRNKVKPKDKSKISPPCASTSFHTSHIGIVCELLQGPYKERQKHIWQRETQCCWTGVRFSLTPPLWYAPGGLIITHLSLWYAPGGLIIMINAL